MDPNRIYPMPAPKHDSRFTYGLLIDAVTLLERHGYPRPSSGPDLVALQQALFGYLYALPVVTPEAVNPPGGTAPTAKQAPCRRSPQQSRDRQENPSMPSNLFGPGNSTERSPQEVQAAQNAARAADAQRERAAAAAGRDRRSIGATR